MDSDRRMCHSIRIGDSDKRLVTGYSRLATPIAAPRPRRSVRFSTVVDTAFPLSAPSALRLRPGHPERSRGMRTPRSLRSPL